MNRRVVSAAMAVAGLLAGAGSGAQVCEQLYRDVHDLYQVAGLKLGDDAERLFRLEARSTDCVRAKMHEEEYGCSFTTPDGTVFQTYAGTIVQAVVPAAALRGPRGLAGIRTRDELRTVIKKLEHHRPERFPVWRAFFNKHTQGVELSTLQCLVSDNDTHWELTLQFDPVGRIKTVQAYVPYP